MNILRCFAFPFNSIQRSACSAFLILVGALFAGLPAQAAVNLLQNPGFELNSGHNIAKGWTRFAPPTAQAYGNYWIEDISKAVPQSGHLFWKEWGASYNGTNNAAGIYQDFCTVPGNTYQASGWFYINPGDQLGADCYVWIEVLFLGSSSNLLALYKSTNFSASVGTSNWFFYGITNACNIASPVSIGDPFFNTYTITGGVSQIVAPAGATTVRYRFVYVQAASQGGSCYFDSAELDQTSGPICPFINNIFPQNMIFVAPTNGMSFNVSSLSGFGISNYNVGLFLNGSNASSGLVFSGSSSNKTATYSGLKSNTVYNAMITVTDSFNLTATASSYFETTWVGVPPVLYLWEAEDYDFNGGHSIDNPVLCATNGGSTCYFGKTGTPDTDYHYVSIPQGLSRPYRVGDLLGMVFSGDYDRPDHYFAGVYDYRLDPVLTGSPNQWMNYTHNWPSNTYWAIGRVSTDLGLNGSITLSTVDSGGNPTDVGTFSINGGLGWSTFENVLLKDTSGNNALLFLNGKQTLRLTSGGNLLPNFIMLVGAIADLPFVNGMYPTGKRPFEYTNAFTFNVTTRGSSFPAGGIRMTLDGFDVTSNLVISGSTATNKSVLLPALLPNAVHLAIITVTNVLGHGIAITNSFDTFNETNMMVEMEDFDYGGGQFITFENWFPDAYSDVVCSCPAAVTNVDFHHTPLSGESGLPNPQYRAIGLPQDKLTISEDYIRNEYVINGAFEWFLAFFAGGDWGNYTRDYPPGSYYAYIRTSGDGPFFLYLDQVVSGIGTLNQTTSRFGTFGGVGKNYTTFAWVPLTDDGLAAPAVVKLTGQTTLRVTTAGNCNPNYFMLIPASGIRLTATRSAGNTVVSFPTQSGVGYRVFYRTNLSAGTWTLLSTVLGNGATKSVNDPVGGAGAVRFYKVTAP